MFTLPSPMHPAVVHFPIVFILLGTLVAIAAVFTQRWHLRWIAAAALVLGAVGAAVAVETGEEEGEYAATATAAADSLLDAHQDWAGRTEVAAILAAALSVGVVAVGRWPRIARGAAAATLAGAFWASWCVYETGHRGGQLVYQHSVGVMAAAPAEDQASTAADHKAARPGHRDEDD